MKAQMVSPRWLRPSVNQKNAATGRMKILGELTRKVAAKIAQGSKPQKKNSPQAPRMYTVAI